MKKAILDKFGAISTPTADEVLGKQHSLWPSIRPLWRPLRLCGPAFTVEAMPGDNLAVHWALAVAPPGSVLVVTHMGDPKHGAWGEIMSTAAVSRGLRGLVSDGAVRDVDACRRLAFPIFCQGVAIKGAAKRSQGALNVPITCAGTLVNPGDLVLADEDGVVIVPAAAIEETLERAQERDAHEARIMEQLRAGQLTIDLLNLRAKLPDLT